MLRLSMNAKNNQWKEKRKQDDMYSDSNYHGKQQQPEQEDSTEIDFMV